MSLCLGAPWKNVFLLQLSFAGSVPKLDVQSVSSADLNGQRALERDATGRTCHKLLRTTKQPQRRCSNKACKCCYHSATFTILL